MSLPIPIFFPRTLLLLAKGRVRIHWLHPKASELETNDIFVGGVGTSEASFEAVMRSGGEEAKFSNGVTEGKEEEEKKSKFRIVVLMMGLWAAIKRAMEKVMEWEWLSWWPFSRQEKRLKKLIAEADVNPKDAALPGTLEILPLYPKFFNRIF